MPSEQEASGRGVTFFFWSFREGLEAWGREKRTEFPKKGEGKRKDAESGLWSI